MNEPLETEIQAVCKTWLLANGIYVWRQNNAAVYHKKIDTFIFHGLKGVSDILGVMPPHAKRDGVSYAGRFLAVEIKRPGSGVLSDDQRSFLDAIQDNGGVSLVVTSVDELEADLKQFIDFNQPRMAF